VPIGLKGLARWPEIDGYLDHAFDLAPAQREHWLAELTSSQPGIARLLRELLAECEALNASQFLEDSPLVDLPTVAGATLEAAWQISGRGRSVRVSCHEPFEHRR
jgi:hypothetical protein